MRTRIFLAAVLAAALPFVALADDDGGDPDNRLLASGKLFAASSHDFSCSLVNKNPSENVTVTLELKNPDGTTYINPSTFQPATLQTTLLPFEAAMLTAPAAFTGTTTLYCWADVPFEAIVFGAFLVRDAGDRASSAVPLQEDVVAAAREIGEGLQDIHTKVDAIDPAGPLTGRMLVETCDSGTSEVPPGGEASRSALCASGQLVTGGGCQVLDSTLSSGVPGFSTFENAPLGSSATPTSWSCAWRNNGTTEMVRFCVEVICADLEPVE